MGWRGILVSLLFSITSVESSSNFRKMWSLNVVSESSPFYSWAVYSAGFFVLVAVVLSMYLIVEHLAAYKQPEVFAYTCSIFLKLFFTCVHHLILWAADLFFLISLWCLIECMLVLLFLYRHLVVVALPSLIVLEKLIRLKYFLSQEQKFLIGLILMVPVYAVESFLSLMDSNAAFNCEIIRDCYEAFALYCFERYLIACLGGEKNTIEFMESQSVVSSSLPLLDDAYAYGVVEHPFPLNCFIREWYLGSDFYQAVKIGIVQYMILKMICALLAVVFHLFGIYGEGKFEWRYAYPYLAVVLNFSQTWALYCLVLFYSVTKNKLAPIKPLAKFLVFKSIVFLTWWQGIAVAFLLSFGTFKGSLAQLLKTRIQDYIICIEMGVAALVHLYVFPAKPYKRGERCVRNVAVLSDYAALDTPPDPEEVRDCERSTRVHISRPEEREKRLKFHQSVRDVVVGSGEIIIDDMKFTVSHVAEPVERGIAKINRTFHQISENVKRYEERRRNSKDDSYVVPLNSWTNEFSEVHDDLVEGSMSDSEMHGKRPHHQSKGMSSLRR